MRSIAFAACALLCAALPLAAQPAPAELDADQLDELAYQVDQLASQQWSARERASKAIVALGPAVGPHLAKLLGEARSAEQLWRMRNALVALGLAHLDPDALNVIVREHLDPLTQRLFVSWEPEAQTAPSLDSEEGGEVFSTILALDRVQLAPMAALLESSPNEILRTNLAYLFGRVADPAYANAVVHATKDESGLVRAQAAHALGAMKAEAHAGRLIEMLKDPERAVQVAAALALVPMRSRSTIEPMISALATGGHVGFAVNWTLEQLTGHETSYNAFRPERRHAGARQWHEWYAEHKDGFEFAEAGQGGRERQTENGMGLDDAGGGRWEFARAGGRGEVLRLVGGAKGGGAPLARLARELREVEALLDRLSPRR